MEWHYEHAGKSLGPVTEEQVYAMHATGIIGPQDRVWRQDWPDWRKACEVWPGAATGSTAAPSATPVSGPYLGGTCEECGAKDPGMVSVGGLPICQNCEPFARDKLSHGMPLGVGPWRDGKQAVMRKDVPLPERCVKCAEPSTTELKKRLSWHPPIIYALILVPLVFLIVALCVRKTLTVRLPLCGSCSRKRRRNIAIAFGSFFGAIALFIVGAILSDTNDKMGAALLVGGGLMLVFCLVWAISIQIVIPKKIDERYAWLDKVGRPWLETLPPWPYS